MNNLQKVHNKSKSKLPYKKWNIQTILKLISPPTKCCRELLDWWIFCAKNVLSYTKQSETFLPKNTYFTASVQCGCNEWLFRVQPTHLDLFNQIQSKSQLYKYLTISSLQIYLQKSVSPHVSFPISTVLLNTEVMITVLVIIRMKKSYLCLYWGTSDQ